MIDKTQFMQLWNCCEYFLAHAPSGVNLASFDLIKQTYQGQATADAFICERLTRPVLAKSAKGIKRLIEDYVQRDCLGQLEKTAISLEDSLKTSLTDNLLSHFEKVLIRYFLGTATDDTAPEALLSLAGAYHTYYKNKEKTGMGLPPWFFSVFFPLLIKSRKGDMRKITDWQQILKQRLSRHWAGTATPGKKLRDFLEDDTTCKLISHTLSGILGFIQEEKDKVFYLFEVTHQLSDAEYKYFQTLAVNGLNSLGNRQKRFTAHAEDIPDKITIGLISKDQIQGIVNTAVDRYFDPALDWCVQYQLSVAAEQPRRKLAKQFDKTFLAMNREIWKELLTLADIQRRVIFRTRHLLRILIYYLFEVRGTDRDFWQKYIASVDSIIHFAFAEEKKRLRQFNTLLGKRLSVYRNTEKYQGTNWEGFYKDRQSRDIAMGVIREIAMKAKSDSDPALPSFWFSRRVEKGVDDRTLYRFFAQGPALD